MPTPEVKQGSADAHRQPSQPANQPDEETDGGTPTQSETRSDEVEVQATGGGDPDPDDPNDPDDATDQLHGGDDDAPLSIFGNKKLLAVIVVLIVIGLYLAAKRAEEAGGQGNLRSGGSNPRRMKATSPDEIDEALADANAPEDRGWRVPQDKDDPLAADGFVISSTGIFPSLGGDNGGE